MKTKFLIGTLAVLGLFATTASAQVTVSSVITNGLAEPCGVTADPDGNFYIADSVNNRIVKVDANTGVPSVFSGTGIAGTNDGPVFQAQFSGPEGVLYAKVGGVGGLVVVDRGNHTIRFITLTNGAVKTLAGQPQLLGLVDNTNGNSAKFSYPVGLTLDSSNNLYIADAGNNKIRVINLSDTNYGVATLVVANTTFRQPNAVVAGDAGELWVADTLNHTIKRIILTTSTNGTMTTLMGSNDRTISGTTDSLYGGLARFNQPRGLLWYSGAGLLIVDTGNNTLRFATNYTAITATNFSVSTYAGIPGQAGELDGAALDAKFNAPFSMTIDPLGNSFVITDRAGNTLRRVQNGPVLPPVSDPQIGWVKFVKDSFGAYVSQLQTGQPFTFNNPVPIAILTEDGSATFYTDGKTPSNPLVDTIPDPSSATGATPPPYEDGWVEGFPVMNVVPDSTHGYDFTIKAISKQTGRRSSAITKARFQFITGNPQINGDNAAQFNVTDETQQAELWYTINGSDPTNASPSIGPISSGNPISLNIGTTNITFKVRAFRSNYKSSDIITKVFSYTNYIPNRISFGFESGEASSDFIASAGQNFIAPVTLSLLPSVKMYSLQFNLTATNLTRTNVTLTNVVGTITNSVAITDVIGIATNVVGTNSVTLTRVISGQTTNVTLTNVIGMTINGTPSPGITPGAIGFESMLLRPLPTTPIIYVTIPPAMFVDYNVQIYTLSNNQGVFVFTNLLPNFTNLVFTNSALNLLGVGWVERFGQTNLYETTKQDVITYSRAHDNVIFSSAGRAIIGEFSFTVPGSATNGETYEIKIGRPSATSDGIGMPGSDVYIDTPANGSLASGAINAIKRVTIGQRKYTVGNVYPFRWFNAGDFGNTNLASADVIQVFQSAIYHTNYPPAGSDFLDAMDSCGATYVDLGHGYLEFNSYISGPAATAPLFDGDDTSVNQIAFGDGVLDVCDVYVTFRRSLDPSLTWFRRYWNAGQRVAEIAPNIVAKSAVSAVVTLKSKAKTKSGSSVSPMVQFTAGDVQGLAGSVVTIPITATVLGGYPLRVLMLNLTVTPLDGSPALTAPVQFTQTAPLGTPYTTDSQINGNFSAVWMDSTIAGLVGTATIGTLTITIPAGASANAAYAVHFDHASGSPNGLASFPKQTLTGLITLSSRTNSSYGDGIPDSWRLRWFGTIYNELSRSNSCPTSDGINNWKKYVAGVDPNTVNNFPSVNPRTPAPLGYTSAIHWPTVSGKQYIIERSTSLFSGAWTAIATNTGTGSDMEFDDNSAGTVNFYRVRILP